MREQVRSVERPSEPQANSFTDLLAFPTTFPPKQPKDRDRNQRKNRHYRSGNSLVQSCKQAK